MNFLNIAELTTRAESVPVLADDIEARPTYQCVRCRHSWPAQPDNFPPRYCPCCGVYDSSKLHQCEH